MYVFFFYQCKLYGVKGIKKVKEVNSLNFLNLSILQKN